MHDQQLKADAQSAGKDGGRKSDSLFATRSRCRRGLYPPKALNEERRMQSIHPERKMDFACRGCAYPASASAESRVSPPQASSSRPSLPATRGARTSQRILGCSTAAGDSPGLPSSSLRTNAASSLSVPVPAACPWPRSSDATGSLEFGVPLTQLRQPSGGGLWAQLQAFWQQLTREGELPPELAAIALFSDGPGAGKTEEDQGKEPVLARLWRHQGLKF